MKTNKIIETNKLDSEVNRTLQMKILKDRAAVLARPFFEEVDNGNAVTICVIIFEYLYLLPAPTRFISSYS